MVGAVRDKRFGCPKHVLDQQYVCAWYAPLAVVFGYWFLAAAHLQLMQLLLAAVAVDAAAADAAAVAAAAVAAASAASAATAAYILKSIFAGVCAICRCMHECMYVGIYIHITYIQICMYVYI